MKQTAEVISTDVKLDPWIHDPDNQIPIPVNVKLVCVWDLHVGIDSIDEAIYFHRGATHDELWSDYLYKVGRVASQRRAGDIETAAKRLLKQLLRSRVGFGWPTRLNQAGLISQEAFQEIRDEVTAALDQVVADTRAHEAPIIQVARELHLLPEPSPTQPGIWKAQCPNGHVGLLLNNKTNDFYCGYCKRSGDEEALALFAREKLGRVGG